MTYDIDTFIEQRAHLICDKHADYIAVMDEYVPAPARGEGTPIQPPKSPANDEQFDKRIRLL